MVKKRQFVLYLNDPDHNKGIEALLDRACACAIHGIVANIMCVENAFIYTEYNINTDQDKRTTTNTMCDLVPYEVSEETLRK